MKPQDQIRLMRWIAAGAVVVIVLLVVMAVMQITPSDGEGPSPKDEVTTIIIEPEDEVPEECDDECNYDIGQTNMSYCERIQDEELKEAFYDKWAYDSLEACLKLSGENKEDCVYHHATEADDLTIREYADNEPACYIHVEPCYEYSIDERRKCIALKKEDYSHCEGDNDCLFDYALEMNAEEACNEITAMANQYACLSILDEKDRCTELNLSANKDLCWQLYATNMDDVSVCFEISDYSSYALNCFTYFAAKTRDPNLCISAGFEFNDLWNCYVEYSLGSEDLEVCHRIHELATTSQFRCYFEYAKKYGNPGACEYLTQSSTKSTCYEGAILGSENINYEYCDDVEVEIWRNKCYTEYAKFNDDSSVCDYITTASERETCINAWEVYIAEE